MNCWVVWNFQHLKNRRYLSLVAMEPGQLFIGLCLGLVMESAVEFCTVMM